MSADPEGLLDRWLADAAALVPEAGRDRWLGEGSRLLAGWSEPHRSYHTVEHLGEMLAALDELEAAAPMAPRDALLARVVTWYHDLAYDPRAAPGSNEHRSATLARDHLHHLGAEEAVVDVVEAGVLMTATHEIEPGPPHPDVLDAVHDADLWVLAAPAERYAVYRRQVRQEYAHVPDGPFSAARAGVLRGFAGRARLYRTGYAHERWTARARSNLQHELQELGDGV